MWSRADNHTILFDTKFSFSLAVGQGSSQAYNLLVNFFCRQRISRYIQNFVRKRAHSNVWSFDISAAEFAQQDNRAYLVWIAPNTSPGAKHQTTICSEIFIL